MRYINAKQCTGITMSGHPCKNHIIDGSYCWLHTPAQIEVDPRKAIVVKAFRCPYCKTLVEIP